MDFISLFNIKHIELKRNMILFLIIVIFNSDHSLITIQFYFICKL
jgi:hypothetical protein